jgi:sugar-specific transcriptional regulator TrmB/DNA-binding CsgD family transcriptional regulator
MLGVLGLSPDEETVYRLMLGRPAAAAADLTGRIGLSEEAVGQALETLARRGLITGTARGFAAAPPAVALGSLISERREELRAAELALAAFAEEHRMASAGRTIGDLIEVVAGVDAVRQRFLQVQYAAGEQVRLFVTSPFVAMPPGENPAEHTNIERGVRVRVIIDRETLSTPGMVDEIVDSLSRGAQIRVAAELPMKLVLADADLALVPLAAQHGGEPGAVLLQRSGLLAALDALFENLWRQAFPLELCTTGVLEAAADGPTDLDRRLLALLVAGLTDQAAASQLDLSLRTVQRRLRHLMDLAGTGSRLQLGWHAARNGWC